MDIRHRINDILNERTGDVDQLEMGLRGGRITSYDQVKQWLFQRTRQKPQSGSFSDVYLTDSGPWVIKVTPNAAADAFYDYAKVCYADKMWNSNSLAPHIRFLTIMPDGTGVCIMERYEINHTKIKQRWGNDYRGVVLRLNAVYHGDQYKVRSSEGDWIVEDPDETYAILEKCGFPKDDLIDILRICRLMGHKLDIDSFNIGFRPDGSLVLIDPIQTNEASLSS